jgi:hypothetical protein
MKWRYRGPVDGERRKDERRDERKDDRVKRELDHN